MAKKFKFSLQKLLNYKEQLFEAERNILAEMNALLLSMQSELAGLYREHKEKSAAYLEQAVQGMTSLDMMMHKNYLLSVEEDIRNKIRQIELQQDAIDKQMDKVKEAKMEISSMEKLKEKKYKEYMYKDSKAQEQFIEEFVSTKRAMSGDSLQ
ncbi:flagellar FliJ family protein [Ruminococcaceae bacterium OttesenSCG-928-L11]|nr:flagellar FliJ family protein [Ruminococcaceae bacterium OttesenSCG-928-L11]